MADPAMTDSDFWVGRKEILKLLRLADWEAVRLIIDTEGLPVEKIGGRVVLSKRGYQEWMDNRGNGMGLVAKRSEVVVVERMEIEEIYPSTTRSIRVAVKKMIHDAIRREVDAYMKEVGDEKSPED